MTIVKYQQRYLIFFMLCDTLKIQALKNTIVKHN
jgi:hypothetical protein